MLSAWFYLFLLGSLCSGMFSAPLDPSYGEKDPELTEGYFEGDIILDSERNGMLAASRQWPNATVPYKISEEFEAPFAAYIEQAMREMEQSSCVRFVPAVNETVYLSVIVSSEGCNTQLGYGTSVRSMQLAPGVLDKGCFRIPVIQHELLHALGFTHQQNSPDRDEYVTIMPENIIVGKESNFEKKSAANYGNYGQPYDYGSVLHYAATAFSINGQPTIVALDPEGTALMGQRVKMSDIDIKRLNTMYQCPIQA